MIRFFLRHQAGVEGMENDRTWIEETIGRVIAHFPMKDGDPSEWLTNS